MANIHLPAIFADGMVLQRNAEVTIWGNADPREEITLKADFLDKKIQVQRKKVKYWYKEKITTGYYLDDYKFD